ncbi:MAG: hypothetical protein OXH70_07400 [Acidobacteria bacterium]|nr:hypothetical protein [Acidobacteriota bacterium]
MSNLEFNRASRAGAVFGVLLLAGLTTQPAAAQYDGTSLDGNLHHQCTNFSARTVGGSSLTVSAECNKQGDREGSVAPARQSTSLELASEVFWDTATHAFTWDSASSEDSNIADKCPTVRGFGVSSTDVTLQLTCAIASTDGTPRTVNADLPLNGNVTVGADGTLSRR